ncbi:MAG: hypothetical protein MK486_10010 [Gemmatimonadetes bacterium]|nr:hypothetical protein [Gemmatimonadota bacterium]
MGRVIQDLMAGRLGRGFVPLGVLSVVGLRELLSIDFIAGDGLVLVLGAIAAGVAMLSCGLRVSQLAFGRAKRPWMSAAMLFSLIPPGFAVYVLAWRGLRLFVVGTGVSGLATAGFFTVAGAWTMYSWTKVAELERLSLAMGTAGKET